MGKINVGRWILGGVIAAIILFIVDYVLNGMILVTQWDDAMTALGLPAMSTSTSVTTLVVFAILNLIVGLTAVWIYTGIRPRFGAGHMTAIYAGLATWLLTYVESHVFLGTIGLLPTGLLWTSVIVGLFQVVIATVIGAYFYQEEAA
jgi:hypothetical protein